VAARLAAVIRRRVATACLLALTVGLAGCGDDDDSAATTTTAATTTAAAASTTAASTVASTAASTTTAAPATTSTAAVTTAAPSTTASGEVVISVSVGVDSSPERVEHVPLGATVVLEMTDPNADQEFHIHDYDLGGNTEVPAGTTARFTFVADRAGSFEVESHVTDDVLVTLEVS
jgi:hypothetical protein